MVAQATVMDVNRQAWSSTTTLLVHPASLYVGLRTDRYFVEKGTPIKVDFIVTDLDGKAISGQTVVITAARLEWKLKAVNGPNRKWMCRPAIQFPKPNRIPAVSRPPLAAATGSLQL